MLNTSLHVCVFDVKCHDLVFVVEFNNNVNIIRSNLGRHT